MSNFTKFVTMANTNAGFITGISTIFYIIFTIIIVTQSKISARGWLFPSLAKVPGEVSDIMCLKIENPTNTPVKNTKISICKKWLSQYTGIASQDAKINLENLVQINTATFTIMPKQTIYYTICIVPGESYEKLTKHPLKVTIKYGLRIGGQTKTYKFDLKGMGTQLAQPNEYVRMERVKFKKFDRIIDKLEGLNRTSN